MRMREFIAGLGGAVAWLLAARAQQPLPTLPAFGFFNVQSADDSKMVVACRDEGAWASSLASRNVAAVAGVGLLREVRRTLTRIRSFMAKPQRPGRRLLPSPSVGSGCGDPALQTSLPYWCCYFCRPWFGFLR
jgi:hypothetical protein